jgi:hypothetical protein
MATATTPVVLLCVRQQFARCLAPTPQSHELARYKKECNAAKDLLFIGASCVWPSGSHPNPLMLSSKNVIGDR